MQRGLVRERRERRVQELPPLQEPPLVERHLLPVPEQPVQFREVELPPPPQEKELELVAAPLEREVEKKVDRDKPERVARTVPLKPGLWPHPPLRQAVVREFEVEDVFEPRHRLGVALQDRPLPLGRGQVFWQLPLRQGEVEEVVEGVPPKQVAPYRFLQQLEVKFREY